MLILLSNYLNWIGFSGGSKTPVPDKKVTFFVNQDYAAILHVREWVGSPRDFIE